MRKRRPITSYGRVVLGRKVYECARGLMGNPTFRKMIQEEAARIREEEAAACL